jgi:cell division protein FtsX
MTVEIKSNWTGSESTFNLVKKQIAQRWGDDEANRYNPKENCLTFNQWLKNGYLVRKGEKALKSFVIVEKKDKETGKVIEKTPKSINLFYELQVEPKTV